LTVQAFEFDITTSDIAFSVVDSR